MTPNSPPADASRHDALPPGAALDGYLVERLLASSRLGHVYLARDTATGQRVAVKEYLPLDLATRHADGAHVLPRGDAREAAFERGRAAFLEEAQLLRRSRHPSLLSVLRAWPEHGTVYRAMPLHNGQRLDELRQGMAEPPDEAALWSLLDGLLGALDTLHTANAVHGDLRPGHVLLLADDSPLLMDGAAVRRAIGGDAQPLRGDDAARAEDLHALAELVVWCIAGDTRAPARGGLFQPNEPLEDLVDRQHARYPGLHYSAGFVNALDAVLSAPPRQRVRSVARFRALLEGDDSGDTVSLADLQPLIGAQANAATAAPTRQRQRADDPAQARTLAALQVALDSIATDAPARQGPRSAPTPLAAVPVPTRPAALESAEAPPRPAPAASAQVPARPTPPRKARGVGLGLALAAVALAGAAAAWLLLAREPAVPVPAPLAVPSPAPAPAPQAIPEPAAPPAIAVASAPAAAAPIEQAVVAETAPVGVAPVEAPTVLATPVVPAPSPAPAPVISGEPVTAAVPAPAPAAAPPKAAAAVVPKPAPKPAAHPAPKPLPAAPAQTTTAAGPRAACGARSEFSLYRCMQTQCKAAQWVQHPQCIKLRATDSVD